MPDSPFCFADRCPDDSVFIEDDRTITTAAFLREREALARELSVLPAGRVGLYTASPFRLALALAACAGAEHELLILRSGQDPRRAAAELGASVFLDAALGVHRLGDPLTRPQAGDVLIGTSGTTGTPKIARHRLSTLMGRVRLARSREGSPKWLLTYEAGGFAGLQMILTALLTPSALIALGDKSVASLAAAAVRHGATHISGTPTFWRAFLVCLGESAARLRLEQITLGGEIADQSILDRLKAVYPDAAICHIYASTEAGALFSVRDGLAGFPSSWLAREIEGVRLRVQGDVLEVRSPRAMQEYVNRAAAYTEDGWLRTGDRVRVTDGRVYFAGREDSTINVGGAKVVAEEVESALLGLPGVVDLRAIAIPNPITGAIIGVEVIAAEGADVRQLTAEILRVGRSRLDAIRCPRAVRFVNELRLDTSGKKSRAHG